MPSKACAACPSRDLDVLEDVHAAGVDPSLLRRCSVELRELCDSLERHQHGTEPRAFWAYALVVALTLPYYVRRQPFQPPSRTFRRLEEAIYRGV